MIDRAWLAAADPLLARPAGSLAAALLTLSLTACGNAAPTLEAVERESTSSPPATLATDARPTTDAPTASVAAGFVRVATITVAAGSLEDEVVLTGELRANEAVSLRSRTEGHVVSLFFREGQAVGRGDLLLKIADTTLNAERKRTAIQLDFAQRREQRAKALFDQKTISQDRYEESANLAGELEAALAVIDARIALTEVRAPFAGTIGLRAVSVGTYLTPSIEIATLHAVDPIKLDLAAPERYAQSIHVGDTVRFDVTGLDPTFEGTVYAIEPRIDSETRTMRVRARAANPGGRLLPGAFARARLTLARRDNALMVPSIALVPGLDSTTVFVVNDGVAQPREVTTGTRTQNQIEIVEGLTVGDEVIVSGVLQVQAGTRVDVAPEAGP